MSQYYFTNKLLIILVIVNIISIVTAVWSMWFLIALLWIAKGNTTQMWINYLSSLIQSFFILGVTTWAFLKKMRWVVIPYTLYLICENPIHTLIQGTGQNWKDIITGHFWVSGNFWGSIVNLGSIVDNFFYVLLCVLTLTTVVVMITETDYRDLYEQWHNWFS